MIFSLYDILSSANNSATLLIHQAGKVYQITKQTLFSNYYTRSEVDQKIANVQAGGVPWQEQVFDNRSISAAGTDTITHNAGNENFDYQCFEWNTTVGKYLRMQTNLAEADRTADTLKLYSGRAITKYKVVIFG